LRFTWRPQQQLGQPDQVVGRERERKGGIHPVTTSQFHLGQTGGTLDPAKHLFDPFAAASFREHSPHLPHSLCSAMPCWSAEPACPLVPTEKQATAPAKVCPDSVLLIQMAKT